MQYVVSSCASQAKGVSQEEHQFLRTKWLHFAGLVNSDGRHFHLLSGVDFVESIEQAVGSCDVLLAVIGKQWLTMKDKKGQNRLADEKDFIRLEIGTALSRNITVVPVLVGGAMMPPADYLPAELTKLARRQAHEISDRRFREDVDELIRTLKKNLGKWEADTPLSISDESPHTTPLEPRRPALPNGAAILTDSALEGLCQEVAFQIHILPGTSPTMVKL